MAIANVQRVTADDGNNTSKAVTISASGAGNLIVVMINYDASVGAGTITLLAPTDNQSNTYVLATGSTAGSGTGMRCGIYYLANCPSGITTITIHVGSEVYTHLDVVIEEWSGVATSSPLDVAGAVSTTGAPVVGPTLTPTVVGELMTGQAVSNSLVITGVSAPFSGVAHNTILPICYANQLNPALSSTHAAFTPTTNATFCSTMAIFKALGNAFTLNLSDTQASADVNNKLPLKALPSNYVQNPGLESWSGGTSFTVVASGSVNPTADSWAALSTGGSSAVISRSATAHSGSFAAQIAVSNVSLDGSSILFFQALTTAMINEIKGKQVRFYCWAKISDPLANVALVLFTGHSGQPAGLPVDVGTGYQLLVGTVTLAANENAVRPEIQIVLGSTTSVTVIVDDFFLGTDEGTTLVDLVTLAGQFSKVLVDSVTDADSRVMRLLKSIADFCFLSDGTVRLQPFGLKDSVRLNTWLSVILHGKAWRS